MDTTPKAQWEYIYQSVPTNQIPWETGQPSSDLVLLLKGKTMRKGMKVLDVGCGLGTQTRFMAEKGALATGIDISETAIRKSREQMLKESIVANFVVGDVCKMPFPNASFEFVYDRGCYHHLSSKQRRDYAKEVSRVLSRMGMLHMLIFAGTMVPREVIEYFLPNFSVVKAYEDIALDHTNNEELAVHIVQFRKI